MSTGGTGATTVRRRALRAAAGLAAGLVLGAGGTVEAQRPEAPRRSELAALPFSFAPPGARALGMGGAFVAIADDATASEANPAGLTILSRPEVSLHGRSSSYDVEVVDVNGTDALAFANGIQEAFGFPQLTADTVSTWDESSGGLSFASFVKPFNRWVLSVYYDQALDFEGSGGTRFVAPEFVDFYSTRNEIEMQLESAGVSAGFKIGDKIALGASLRQSRLDLRQVREFRLDYFADLELDPSGIFTLDNITDVILFRDTIAGDDDDITYNVGLLVNPNGRWSIGAVYKEGGEYSIDTTALSFDCVSFPEALGGGPRCDPETLQGEIIFQADRTRSETSFEIPDYAGIGVALRPNDRLILALDASYITYSDLSDGFTEEIDDQTEIHFGLEYTLLPGDGRTPVSLRAGAYTDSDHDGFAEIDSDQTHITAGAGVVIRQDLQIDVAGHFSDTVDQFVLSGVYRF